MGQDISQSTLAVYFHVPFCLQRCNYCSFYSETFSRAELERYTEYLNLEIQLYQEFRPELKNADTIYFGGGTPSLLSATQIRAILANFSYSSETEISLEINPLQITPAYLQELSQTDVNRLSIGLQSMLDEELDWLTRRHRAAQIKEKIGWLRDYGFPNFSLDLIYGLPGTNLEALSWNLERYLELEPRHISTYLLERERLDPALPGPEYRTPGALSTPIDIEEDELQAQSYELIRKVLLGSGYEHYEISNFALPGSESGHNLHYWQSDDYLGLGASATGFLKGARYTNPPDLERYYHNVKTGRLIPDPEAGQNPANDYLMMGLRLLRGIDLAQYRDIFGKDLALQKADSISKLRKLGLLQIVNGYLRLSPDALFISNAVIGEMLEP